VAEMAKQNQFEQLDRLIDVILSRPRGAPPRVKGALATFARVFPPLLDLPAPDFRERLKADLQRRASMASKQAAVPETHQSATAYLCVKGAAAAIEFYKKAFGAAEVMRLNEPGPRIGHAEIRIGNSFISLSDEYPDYATLSPQSLGGSPVKIKLLVDDVDAFARTAVAAGATVVRPVQDQFYGERSGQLADPFGYTWIISTHMEDVTAAEMQRRIDSMIQQAGQTKPEAPAGSKVTFIRKGFTTLTPYVIVQDATSLIDFTKRTFNAEEIFRDIGSAGGVHCEMRLGDSIMMIGGGGPGTTWKGESRPMAFHVYVEDIDAIYRRALEAGATTINEPADQPYGERSASVKDASGNFWYIATRLTGSYKPSGLPTVQPYMHPLRAVPVINFMKQAFGAVELGRATSPEGIIHHTMVKIGDGALEMGEAQGPYQPMPGAYYLYVPDADTVYHRALAAGAKSLSEPADMPYGDRVGGVKDAFGNDWYVATHIKDFAE
jgi:PhnB protein